MIYATTVTVVNSFTGETSLLTALGDYNDDFALVSARMHAEKLEPNAYQHTTYTVQRWDNGSPSFRHTLAIRENGDVFKLKAGSSFGPANSDQKSIL